MVLKAGRTDLRRGIDGLASIIRLFGLDPLEKGTLYLFCGSRPDRIRGLIYEGDGYVLVTKRLSGNNRFQWPRTSEDMEHITLSQYKNLMEGFAIEGTIREVKPEEKEKKVKEICKKSLPYR